MRTIDIRTSSLHYGCTSVPNHWTTPIESILSVNNGDNKEKNYFLGQECQAEDIFSLSEENNPGIFIPRLKTGRMGTGEFLTVSESNTFYSYPNPDRILDREYFDTFADCYKHVGNDCYTPLLNTDENWKSREVLFWAERNILEIENLYLGLCNHKISAREIFVSISYRPTETMKCELIFPARYINYRNPAAKEIPEYIQIISGYVLFTSGEAFRVGYIAAHISLNSGEADRIEGISKIYKLESGLSGRISPLIFSSNGNTKGILIPSYSNVNVINGNISVFRYY